MNFLDLFELSVSRISDSGYRRPDIGYRLHDIARHTHYTAVVRLVSRNSQTLTAWNMIKGKQNNQLIAHQI